MDVAIIQKQHAAALVENRKRSRKFKEKEHFKRKMLAEDVSGVYSRSEEEGEGVGGVEEEEEEERNEF